jgi:ornithine cyclodeaminase/alanine dehydrogenase-like protein (mu-crystallin family)
MEIRKVEPRFLSLSDIEAVAMPLTEVIEIVEDTYRAAGLGHVEVPTKIGVHPDYPNSFLHAMPAWVSSRRALGMKYISYYPGNSERGLPDSTGIIILNHPDHGLPVAIMEGMWITYARTAACAAVMAKYFSPPEPMRLGLIGCGGLGNWSLRMLSQLFPSLSEINVSSRTQASREKFAADMAKAGPWRLRAVRYPREAVEGMDIIVSSIPRPPVPILDAACWNAGSLAIPLDVIGTWDQSSMTATDRLVTDDFDGLIKYAASVDPTLRLPGACTDIGAVVAGKADGRKTRTERVMAIPTGVASVDLTIAWVIYERAQRRGLGRTFTLT